MVRGWLNLSASTLEIVVGSHRLPAGRLSRTRVPAEGFLGCPCISPKPLVVAVLDLNLNGMLSYPVAKVIRGRGISIIFVTGYGGAGLPEKFRGYPTLQKPFSQQDFAQAVAAACDLSSIEKEQGVPSHL